MKKIKWPIGLLLFGLLAFSFTTFFWDSVNSEEPSEIVKIEEKDKPITTSTIVDSSKVLLDESIKRISQRSAPLNKIDTFVMDESVEIGTPICTDSTHSRNSSVENRHYSRRKPSTAKIISSYVSGFFSLIGFGWTVYGIIKEIKEKKSLKAKAKARAEKRAKTVVATRARVAAGKTVKK